MICNFSLYFIHAAGTIQVTVDEEEKQLSVGHVLAFFTGSDLIPPLEFSEQPSLNFNPVNMYPTSSTCANTLTLPSHYTEYELFKDKLIQGFTMHGGFGLC